MNDLFFLPVLNRSLSACWLILAVLLLRVLFKKAPAYLRIVLWMFVGLRLIIPFDIKTDLSLIPSAKPLTEYTVQYEMEPKIDSGIKPIDEAINPVFTETFKADPANSVNPLYVHTSIAGIVWIFGIAILLLCSLISHFRLKKRLSDSIPLSEEIRLCDHIETPFVYGLFQPMIYLPSSLNEKDRKIVLKHERMHIARRDHLLKPLAYLISIVHWFNPLVWLSYHLFCKDIEIACDEAVIKDMTLQEKKDYSKTLLSCAAHKRFVFSYPLAFGEVGIKERVKNVLDYKKPSFWIILAGIVICIVTGVCFLTNPKHNPDASYLLENFDRKNIDDITIMYDFDYSEYESTDRFYSKEAVLADLDPKDQKRIMRQIESILRDEEFEEVPREEIRGEGSLWRLLILDSKKVNITVYQKEGYIGTKDPESDIGWPMVYKVNNDKLNKLCGIVDEATGKTDPSIVSERPSRSITKEELKIELHSPVNNGELTCDFGGYQGHAGIDLIDTSKENGPVYAIAGGVVRQTFYDSESGNGIVMDHQNGYYSFYAHLKSMTCQAGDYIDAGKQIGIIGNTGNTDGHHLHLALFDKDGNYISNLSELLGFQNSEVSYLSSEIRITSINEIQGDAIKQGTFEGPSSVRTGDISVESVFPVNDINCRKMFIDILEERGIKWIDQAKTDASAIYEIEEGRKASVFFIPYLYEISFSLEGKDKTVEYAALMPKTLDTEEMIADGLWFMEYEN